MLAALPDVEIDLRSVAEITAALDGDAISKRRQELEAYLSRIREPLAERPGLPRHHRSSDVSDGRGQLVIQSLASAVITHLTTSTQLQTHLAATMRLNSTHAPTQLHRELAPHWRLLLR
jgi:hypothetical protein